MDFNPRSPCGERLTMQAEDFLRLYISIHAPRAGSDGNKPHCRTLGTISIHAPRAGSDQRRAIIIPRAGRFQSTLPVRGATDKEYRDALKEIISIHAPRAGSDVNVHGAEVYQAEISIHAPRAGSDHILVASFAIVRGFQSTLPVRGATFSPGYAEVIALFQSTLPVRGATIRRDR